MFNVEGVLEELKPKRCKYCDEYCKDIAYVQDPLSRLKNKLNYIWICGDCYEECLETEADIRSEQEIEDD